jgi:hypothetical protein
MSDSGILSKLNGLLISYAAYNTVCPFGLGLENKMGDPDCNAISLVLPLPLLVVIGPVVVEEEDKGVVAIPRDFFVNGYGKDDRFENVNDKLG